MKFPPLHWLRSRTYRAGIVVSWAANAAVKFLSFGTSLVIAYFYGAGEETDVYFYTVNCLLILAGFFHGINKAVLIPEAIRLSAQESEERARAFLNVFLYGVAGAAAVGTLLLLISPVRAFRALSRFDAGLIESHRPLFVAAALVLFFRVTAQYLTDILQSRKFFVLPNLLEGVNALLVIGAVLLFRNTLGLTGALYGLLAGFVLQCLALAALMRRSLGWRFAPRRVRIGRGVWRDLGLVQIEGGLLAVSSYLPLWLLSGFGQGVIAALNYALRISQLPFFFLTNQFVAVAGIKFNELYAQRKWKDLDQVFRASADFLVFLLLPFSGFMFLFSKEAVAVLLGRGRFDAASVAVTAELLRYLSLLPWLRAVQVAVTRLFKAGRRVAPFQIVAAIHHLLQIALIVTAIRWLGYVGFPLARLTGGLIYVAALAPIALRRFFPMVRFREHLKRTGLVLATNAGICVPIAILQAVWTHGDLSLLILSTALYGGALLALNHFARLNTEARELAVTLGRRIRGRSRADGPDPDKTQGTDRTDP